MCFQLDDKHPNVASIILAGGKGTRLFPLTISHSKPAVCYGGRYRLIDIPISNSLNSNIRQIFVLAQYLTSELQHHLSQTYHFDPFFTGMVDLLTPEEQSNGSKVWFDGTADAVRKNLDTILKAPVDYFIILSGDQLYNINFKKMLDFTIEKDANLTIASIPVNATDAKRMGILKMNQNHFITDFIEKPDTDEQLLPFEYSSEKNGIEKKFIGSMGIYIFKREALQNLLFEDPRGDFGKHLIPTEIKKGKTAAFLYDGYWEDIGTIESFYKANMALNQKHFQGLQMYDEANPIYTQSNHLPGAKIYHSEINQSLICEGCIIKAKEICNSIIGLRAHIHEGTRISDSIIMGNHFYFSPSQLTHTLPEKFEIGKDCLIEKTIIDEHVYIGNNVQLINQDHHQNYDGKNLFVRDGIIIIPANTHLPDHFVF